MLEKGTGGEWVDRKKGGRGIGEKGIERFEKGESKGSRIFPLKEDSVAKTRSRKTKKGNVCDGGGPPPPSPPPSASAPPQN